MSPEPVLFVTKEFAVAATSGGMLRTLAMVRWLAARAPVVVVCPAGVFGARAVDGAIRIETLRERPRTSRFADAATVWRYRSIGAPRTCGAALLVALTEALDRLGPFACALIDHTCVFGVVDLLPARLPVVLSTHNVESDLMAQRAAAETGWRRHAARIEAVLLRRLERSVGRSFPLVVCTQADGAAVAGEGGAADVLVARNGVAPPVRPGRAARWPGSSAAETEELLFTGALDWRPNVNGILWLLDSDAWAALVAERPQIRFTVAGRNPSADFRRRVQAAPRARLEADVVSMRPLLERARLGLAPLLEGSGSRIKLLEYIAHALPSVSTHVGAAGLEDLPEHAVVRVAQDPEAFCAAVREQLDHGPAVLAPATVQAVLDRYDWDVALRPLQAVLART